MFVTINDELVLIETSRKCFLTDLDMVLYLVECSEKTIKSNNKYYSKGRVKPFSNRSLSGKKFQLLEWGEVGTKPKLIQELKWLFENNYFVSKISFNGLNQIIIGIENKNYSYSYREHF